MKYSVLLDTTPDKSIGILYPLTNTKGGVFDKSYTTADQIKSNLQLLFLTCIGERPMQPKFGSALNNLVFESLPRNIQDLNARVLDIITAATDLWMPFITVDQLNCVVDEIKHSLKIIIDYSINYNEYTKDMLTLNIHL